MERTRESRCVMKTAAATFSPQEMSIKYVCGVDIGSQSCAGCILRLDKSVVVKPISFANAREGWQIWEEKLSQLDAVPSQILIGMEATSRYGENLYQELEYRGYVLRLLHAGQTHQFHQQQGLRAKTDRLDAMTIARVLLSGEARAGYVPSERIATYRELVRLHTQREPMRQQPTKTRSRRSSWSSSQSSRRSRHDPCLPTALAVRNRVSQCPGRSRSRRRTHRGVAAPDARAFWPSDCSETGRLRQQEWKQWKSGRGTIHEPADSLRSTGAYPSESGSFRSRHSATPDQRSGGKGAPTGARICPHDGDGL